MTDKPQAYSAATEVSQIRERRTTRTLGHTQQTGRLVLQVTTLLTFTLLR